jgi:cell division septation protein DedD
MNEPEFDVDVSRDHRAEPMLEPESAVGTASPRSGLARYRRPAVLGLVAVALVAVGWSLVPGDNAPGSPEDVPLILAEDTPTKERPADPGGITIPNQDKLVYDLIEPTRQDGEVVERLLPPPEEPVVIAPLPAEPEAIDPAATADAIGEALDEPEETVAAVPEVPAEPEEGATEAAETLAEVAPAAGTDATAEAATETVSATFDETVDQAVAALEEEEADATSSRTWRVQIGAVKDETQVEPEWQRLKGKLGALVAGLALKVETADLGSGQGLYHRLQVGAFADRNGAEGLCTEFKARGVDCLVVRR